MMYNNYKIDEECSLPILKNLDGFSPEAVFMEVRVYNYHTIEEIMFAAVGTYDEPTKRYEQRVSLHDNLSPYLVAIFHIKIKKL